MLSNGFVAQHRIMRSGGLGRIEWLRALRWGRVIRGECRTVVRLFGSERGSGSLNARLDVTAEGMNVSDVPSGLGSLTAGR